MIDNIKKVFIIKSVAGITLLLMLSACQIDLQRPPNTIENTIDDAIERGFDGIIVYVNQGGKSKFYSAGWNNREHKILAKPHTLFKIGSISKLYIAAAASKLVAHHRLSLNETLAELIPEVAGRIEYANEITLRMLLQHRTGIPDFLFDPEFKNSSPNDDYLSTASLIFDEPAEFAPDKKYRYSNTNYLLIGEILDRALGYSHHDYIRDSILIPMGLQHTYNVYSEVNPDSVMSGYYIGYDADLKPNDFTRPGGSMVATAEDVGKFLRALIDGTLFNEKEQTIYSSVYVYEHTGWLVGYTSIARYHADIDAVVVQFVNTSGDQVFWLELNRVYNRIVKSIEKKQ